MSFILDALKKSESDRQRQTGPALFEVKVAAPKSRLPVWAVAVGVLLIVNMLIVGWLLLRRPARSDEGAMRDPAREAATGSSSTMSSAPAHSEDASRSSVAGPSVALIQASPGSAAGGVPQPAPPTNSSPAALSRNPSPGESGYAAPSVNGANPSSNTGAAMNAPPYPGAYTQSTPSNSAGQPTSPPALANAPAGSPAGAAPVGRNANLGNNEPTLGGATAAQGPGTEGGNPDDYAPATESGGVPFKGHVKRGTESGYVLYQDAAMVPGANLPQLRLDLHVYAPKAEDRFALINMKRMREGDTLPDGIKVENIIPDGVVMSHNGSKFLLPRD